MSLSEEQQSELQQRFKDLVEHKGKAKTVVAVSLTMVCLDDRMPDEVKALDPMKYHYGPWIDKRLLQ